MQLTTISAMNGPIALWMSGTTAWSVMSATDTKVAMIMMYDVIRISPGMNRLSRETKKLEPMSTNVVAAPMASAFATVLVTARVGQSPSIWTSTGLSVQRPGTNA